MKLAALTITLLTQAATAIPDASATQRALGVQDASAAPAEVASSPFFFLQGGACGEFRLPQTSEVPYLKKYCPVYQQGRCASQGYTVAAGSKVNDGRTGVVPCDLGGALPETRFTVDFYKKASYFAQPTWTTENIVELAAGDKDLSTLVAAVKHAGLVGALEGKGPLTVFAPTNEAFAKLPARALKKLLQPQNVGKLTSILTYHVVQGSVHAKDLRDGEMVTTLEGQKLRVTVNRAGVFIDGAKVTTADVDASNGVVHIIDSVLLPPKKVVRSAFRRL